jgi:hypothetical protein
MSDLYYVENDTLPEVQCTYTDTDGNAIDITGYTFEIHVQYAVPLSNAGVIVDAANGIFKFEWGSGDIQSGTWNAEIQITDAGGKILTFQGLRLVVEPEIA